MRATTTRRRHGPMSSCPGCSSSTSSSPGSASRPTPGDGDLDRRHGLGPGRHRQLRRRAAPRSACAPRWPRPSATTSTAGTAGSTWPSRKASTSSPSRRFARLAHAGHRLPRRTTATGPWSPTASSRPCAPDELIGDPPRSRAGGRPPRTPSRTAGSPRRSRERHPDLRRRRLGPDPAVVRRPARPARPVPRLHAQRDRGDGATPAPTPPRGARHARRAGAAGRGHPRRRRRHRHRPARRASTRTSRRSRATPSTRPAPATSSARASSRPRSAAGRWPTGCGSPSSPRRCPCGSTAARSAAPGWYGHRLAGGTRSRPTPEPARDYGLPRPTSSRRTWSSTVEAPIQRTLDENLLSAETA